MPILSWAGCYEESWRGLIVDDAFAHPAKFAPGLVRRIYGYMLERGWLAPGELVADPFGGIAGGGIVAAYLGLRWRGVELEPRFVELGGRNIALHAGKLAALGLPVPELVQGDSRGFAGIVGEAAGVLTSPPYGGEVIHARPSKMAVEFHQGRQCATGLGSYGSAPGQIGDLPTGEVSAVVTPPPYAGSVESRGDGIDWGKACERGTRTAGRGAIADGYGASNGQIGALPSGTVDGVVTSPPWEDQAEGGLRGTKFKDPAAFAAKMSAADGKNGRHAASPEARAAQLARDADRVYGESEGQIGVGAGETYWQAVATVYAQCLAALRVGGVLAVVLKDYVKGGKRVPLCDDTLRLLVSLGFEPLARAHAHLVKETTHHGLFGKVTRKTERKSFFRRLAEKKGSPRIDWECVLFVRRPA